MLSARPTAGLGKSTEVRIEKDTFGDIKVQADKYWGAQTQRSEHSSGLRSSLPISLLHSVGASEIGSCSIGVAQHISLTRAVDLFVPPRVL